MTTTTERLVSVKTGNPFSFESTTCSRCGGSGHYSYCQSHGTRCFKCGGHGIVLTKRGAVAQQVFNEMLTVEAQDVEPGMKVLDSGVPGIIPGGWREVESVKLVGDEVHIEADGYGERTSMGSPVRIARTNGEKQEFKAAALRYQETLTKQGKPRKR